jgi:choline dehydrogenase-like flavoprotein
MIDGPRETRMTGQRLFRFPQGAHAAIRGAGASSAFHCVVHQKIRYQQRDHTESAATPDPNAHHHAGTTRMHVDPRHGVVDPDLHVHQTTNLYVAGASVFATAGFANPTLTIVALPLRVADHLLRTR